MQRVNLDYYAGTTVLPEVKQAMAAALEEGGNPSSIHAAGRQASLRLEEARKQVAALIGAKPAEISFTSSGTESNAWALRGLLAANKRKGQHVIISAIEHPSIALAVRRLELEGARISIMPVDRDGLVSSATLKALLQPDTVLVSIMLANGEVGTIQPVQELAAIAHEHGAIFHTDAVAAAGHLPIDVRALKVDALTLAANQFYGPPGAAALFVKDGVRILPLLEGGGQENGSRSGTEAVPAIVGMGVAAEVSRQRLSQRADRVRTLRDRLRDGLLQMEGVRVNGLLTSRLPHNLHVCISGASSESLVLGLDAAGIAAGIGSACNSKAMRPSAVLKAMGLTDEEANGALVLTVGEPTTDEDIARALEIIPTVVRQLRNVTALTARK